MSHLPYANKVLHTDVEPYEVVRAINDNTLEVRPMNYEPDAWDAEWTAGGFAGHCLNIHDQRWIITRNPAADTRRIRKHKDCKWYDRNGGRYNLSGRPRRWYDYNF